MYWRISTWQNPCPLTTTGAASALFYLFAQEFLDLDARDHGDGVPGTLFGTNGTASADIPVDNDHLMCTVTGIIGIINLIDTIDGTKVHTPFAPRAPVDINPGFWARSTRALRSLRHKSPPLVEPPAHWAYFNALATCLQVYTNEACPKACFGIERHMVALTPLS